MSTIKTKIGFDTKPYVIKTIYFDKLFNIPSKVYGQILLLVATLLSASSCAYLYSIQHVKIRQLREIQQNKVELEQKYHALLSEYKQLTAPSRLASISLSLGMQKPVKEKTIYFPNH